MLLQIDPTATPIHEVEDIRRLSADTSSTGTQWGTGGMVTKLTAARIATAAGCCMVICSSDHPESILAILAGEKIGTKFHPLQKALKGRKRWILSGERCGDCCIICLRGRYIMSCRSLCTASLSVLLKHAMPPATKRLADALCSRRLCEYNVLLSLSCCVQTVCSKQPDVISRNPPCKLRIYCDSLLAPTALAACLLCSACSWCYLDGCRRCEGSVHQAHVTVQCRRCQSNWGLLCTRCSVVV